VASDTFYIEQPGVSYGAYSIGDDAIAPNRLRQFAGVQTTGTATITDGHFQHAFCRFNAISAGLCKQVTLSDTYAHPVRGNLLVGGNRVETTSAFNSCTGITFPELCAVGTFSVSGTSVTLACNRGSVFAGGISIINDYLGASLSIGTIAVTGVGPRIIGAGGASGFNAGSSCVGFNQLAVTNCGAKPAFALSGGLSIVSFFSTGNQNVTGATGNNDVGLDLTKAHGSVIYIDSTLAPTVTGALGDVRLAGGQIITWAQAMTGVTDVAGNTITAGPITATLAATRAPLKRAGFSGSIIGAVGATVSYLADTGPMAANQTTPLRRATSAMLVRSLRVTNLVNVSANPVTVTIYKNGVATLAQVSIPAATAANTKFADLAHQVFFADGDDLDVRLDDAGDVGGVVTVSGFVEYC